METRISFRTLTKVEAFKGDQLCILTFYEGDAEACIFMPVELMPLAVNVASMFADAIGARERGSIIADLDPTLGGTIIPSHPIDMMAAQAVEMYGGQSDEF